MKNKKTPSRWEEMSDDQKFDWLAKLMGWSRVGHCFYNRNDRFICSDWNPFTNWDDTMQVIQKMGPRMNFFLEPDGRQTIFVHKDPQAEILRAIHDVVMIGRRPPLLPTARVASSRGKKSPRRGSV